MKILLKKIYIYWLRISLFIGNIISTIILVVFYYTIFAIFAIPYKIFQSKNWFLKKAESSWRNKIKNPEDFSFFVNE